ncbi:TPM domain-containing protein [Sphingosinicella sp.]|uniref:TPM domain-containing protein n=1 Tax=Sphingosinicella sp. TaxID=1917971 RepID=UPI00179137BA|nr:TPM domain-containing protein [Sphingosinicella sp.]MBA4758081.1 TPM domain-containing protein [Sphingosinicella sp.]
MFRLACLAALLLAFPAAAQEFPKLSGRVVDAADLLSPATEAALTEKLKTLEDTTTRQLVVATVPDLQGYDIADYGYRLGREWGLGRKNEDNGALLLVAPNERKVRIEVGYGLEGYLTDALSSVIINRQIVPRFRDGDMEGGVVAGADAIIAQLSLPPEDARANLIAARESEQEETRHGLGLIPTILIIWFVFWMLRGVLGGKRRRGRGGPIIIWGPGSGGGWGGGSSGGFGGGGFSGGGGSFGGGGASGSW